MYLIYSYISPSNKRYIGQTCESLSKRAGKNGIRYKSSPAFWKAIQKYGWAYFQKHREVLATATDREEANTLESYFIDMYNTTNKLYGYNILSGGYDGFGLTNALPIIGINLSNHSIQSFISYSEAARQLGIQEATISEIVKKTGKYNTTHGWTFALEEDYQKMSDEEKEELFKIVPNRKPKLHKRVRCINTGEIFDSVTDAANKKQCARTHLSSVCKKIRNSCGKDENGNPLYWEYI